VAGDVVVDGVVVVEGETEVTGHGGWVGGGELGEVVDLGGCGWEEVWRADVGAEEIVGWVYCKKILRDGMLRFKILWLEEEAR